MEETRRPSFAEDFPRTPDLDSAVDAFARGDYASVRVRAMQLARSSPDEPVRRAALLLVERTRPEPLSVALLVMAALLLVIIGGWWMLSGTPGAGR